jgi:hypothetical protein
MRRVFLAFDFPFFFFVVAYLVAFGRRLSLSLSICLGLLPKRCFYITLLLCDIHTYTDTYTYRIQTDTDTNTDSFFKKKHV